MQKALAVFALFQTFWKIALSGPLRGSSETSTLHLRAEQQRFISFGDLMNYNPGERVKFDLKSTKLQASLTDSVISQDVLANYPDDLKSKQLLNVVDAGQAMQVLFYSPSSISWVNTSRIIPGERSLRYLQLEASLSCTDSVTHIASQSLVVACTQPVSPGPSEQQPYLPKQKTTLIIIRIADGVVLSSLAVYQPPSYTSAKGTRVKWLDDAQLALIIYSPAGGDLTATVENLGLLACKGFEAELDKVQCSWIERIGDSQVSGVSLSSLHEISPLLWKNKAPQYKIMLSGRTPEWNFTSYVECSVNFPTYISCGEVLPYTKGLTFQLDQTSTANYDSRTGVLQIGPSPYNLTAVCPQFNKVYLPEGTFVRDIIKSRQFLILQVASFQSPSRRVGHIVLDTANKKSVPFLEFTKYQGSFESDSSQLDDLLYVHLDTVKQKLVSAKIAIPGLMFPALDPVETQEGEITVTAYFNDSSSAGQTVTRNVVRWGDKWGKPKLTSGRYGLPNFQLMYKSYLPLPIRFDERVQGNNITLSFNETNEMAGVVDYQIYASQTLEFFLKQKQAEASNPEQFYFGDGYLFALDAGTTPGKLASIRLSTCSFPNDKSLVCSHSLSIKDKLFDSLSQATILASARGGTIGQFYGLLLKAVRGGNPVLISIHVRGASMALEYVELEQDAVVKSATGLGLAARDGQVLIAWAVGIQRTQTPKSDYAMTFLAERGQEGLIARNRIESTTTRPVCNPLVALTYWTTPDRFGLGTPSATVHNFELDGAPRLAVKVPEWIESIDKFCQLSATQAILQYGRRIASLDTSGMVSSFREVDFLSPSENPNLLCKDAGSLVAVATPINSTLTEMTILDLTAGSSLRQVHSQMRLAGSLEQAGIHSLQDRAIVTHFTAEQGLTGFSAFKLWPKMLLDITPKLGFNFTAQKSDRLVTGDNFLVATDQLNQNDSLKVNMSVFDQNYTITYKVKQSKQKLTSGTHDLESLIDVNGPVLSKYLME